MQTKFAEILKAENKGWHQLGYAAISVAGYFILMIAIRYLSNANMR